MAFQMHSHGEQGFSLIELMVVIAVIVIAAAVAVPTFMQWIPDMRLKESARTLFGTAMFAKGEAIKRNKWCALSFNISISGKTRAYAVFEDKNKNCEYDQGVDTVLRTVDSWPNLVSLDTTGITFIPNDNGFPTIVFRPTSIPTDNNGGLANGSVFLKSSNGMKTSVVINQAGNISIK